jgi:pimeloyl-ACP methyl ester carboxylesterase
MRQLRLALAALLFMAAPAVAGVRIVELHAADGTPLKASYFAARHPGPAVILFHQGDRDRRSWDDLAIRLAASGINTLTIDMRGFGDSGGKRFDSMSGQERQELRETLWPSDIEAAWRFLVSQPGVRTNEIGLAGAGFDGVDNAVLTASRHAGQVKSLVLLSGETFMNGLRFLHRAPQLAILAVADNRDEFPPTVEAMELLYAMSATGHKSLIHYGGPEAPWLGYEDQPGPPANGGHGTDMFRVHPELEGKIVAFLRDTLRQAPAKASANFAGGAPLPFEGIVKRLEEPGGVAAVTEQLKIARAKDPKAQLWPEIVLSLLAGDHLSVGDTQQAIALMELNLAAYPDSAGINDDIAGAYLKAGKIEIARQHAERSLQILKNPGATATSWSNTEPQRAAILRSVTRTLEGIDSREAKLVHASKPATEEPK